MEATTFSVQNQEKPALAKVSKLMVANVKIVVRAEPLTFHVLAQVLTKFLWKAKRKHEWDENLRNSHVTQDLFKL